MAAVCSSEIAEIILSHLQDPADLIACSAVCHKWHAAYRSSRISSLRLSVPYVGDIGGSTVTPEEVCGLMHWLQAHQARGNLCHVKTLTVVGQQALSDPCSFICGAVLMLAGTWPLEDVEMSGSLDFDMALVLLPALLKRWKLCPNSEDLPGVVDLASLRKFTALQTLIIYSYDDDPKYSPGNCFLLSTTLTNLTSMTVSSWPLLLQDGCSVADCLPSLVHASLVVHMELVNAFTLLDQFKALFLVLMDPVPLPQDSSLTITVECTSQLRKLVLCGPVLTTVDLIVNKPGVQLWCRNISLQEIKVATVNAFEELAWHVEF